MKFFALVFLFGLASASLLEIYPDSDEEDFLLKTVKTGEQKKKDDLQTELGRKLKETFMKILKHIHQTVEDGKSVSKKLFDQAKHLAKKLKEHGLEISDEAKDMLKYWEKRATRWVDELLDIIRGDNSTAYYSEPEVKTELAKKLREKFEDIVKRIKHLVEEGKHVSEKLLDESKDLARKLREHGLRIKDEVIDMLEYVKERYQSWVQDLIDVIRGKKE